MTQALDPGPRFPQANSSKRVRDVLWETIVGPLAESRTTRFLAFRLVWCRKDMVEDDVWAHMAEYRHLMDRQLAAIPGPGLFISSVSANVSHQGKEQNVIPCLGYFVVVDDPAFVESSLYVPMRENSVGAVLKLVSLPATVKEDRRIQMLGKLIKDYGDGYVRRRMDSYGHGHEPLVVTYIHNSRYEPLLTSAASVLASSIGLQMELKPY